MSQIFNKNNPSNYFDYDLYLKNPRINSILQKRKKYLYNKLFKNKNNDS